MGANVSNGSRTTYYYIVDGRLKTLASKDDPNAINRVGVVGDTHYSKWEKNIDSLTGNITNVFIKDLEFGRVLNIIIEDGIEHMTLQIGVESQYASSFLSKAMNIDFTKKVDLRSYAIEKDNGKTNNGISIKQGGDKISSYYYNEITKEPINGIPTPDKPNNSMDKDDWKMYFIMVRKFLTAVLDNELKEKIKQSQPFYVVDQSQDQIHDTLAEQIKKELENNSSDYGDDLPF